MSILSLPEANKTIAMKPRVVELHNFLREIEIKDRPRARMEEEAAL
jgi:hypothetical protein